MPMNRGGFTLLEVLITLIVLAIGMLGLANLQTKVHTAELESYQRAHAVLLLQDMVDRINTNRANAAAYVTGPSAPVGTGSSVTACSGAPGTTRDKCEWSNSLLGSSETSGGSNVGAMLGARGCVELVSAAVVGTCTPATYRVSVVWQGINDTVAPTLTCAQNLYGRETLRRLVSTNVTIGLPAC